MPSAPKDDDLPSTLQRSDQKAQDTFAAAHDSALDTYDGDAQAANRVAWSAVKHTHEKVGDHWEPKEENGLSDEQSAHGDRDTDLGTAGGVDANATKEHLYSRAQELDVEGRSTMTKDELVEALEKANDQATRDARG
jgi:cation transport regulator ChaB